MFGWTSDQYTNVFYKTCYQLPWKQKNEPNSSVPINGSIWPKYPNNFLANQDTRQSIPFSSFKLDDPCFDGSDTLGCIFK